MNIGVTYSGLLGRKVCTVLLDEALDETGFAEHRY